MTQTPQFHSFTTQPVVAQAQQQPSQQIAPEPALNNPPEPDPNALPSTNSHKKKFTRIIAIVIILALAVALYFIWHTPASTNAPPVITQQNFSGTSSNSSGTTGSSLTTN